MESAIRTEVEQEEQVKTAQTLANTAGTEASEQPLLRIVDKPTDEPDEAQTNDHGHEVATAVDTADVHTPVYPVCTRTVPEVLWNEDLPPQKNAVVLARALHDVGDVYRAPDYAGGLVLGSQDPNVPPLQIINGGQLAPVILDRVHIRVFKNGKPKGSQIGASYLNTLLRTEIFLQEFAPLDAVVTTPMYLDDFTLAKPGYNDGRAGQHILYRGAPAEIRAEPSAINAFLDVMAFASVADRTNAVAAALTVLLRNHWPGAKPAATFTSIKSGSGKNTVTDFAIGTTPQASITYQSTDWALEQNFASILQHNPDVGVVVIDNVRLGRGDRQIQSGFLERLLTDPNPIVFTTGAGDPRRRRNDIVVAISTNFGQLSRDLMNRALPIHLNATGDLARRVSPIGNPRLEYLPKYRDQIQAELRGMVERWKAAGKPLDLRVRHLFAAWAQTIGGILQVNGFQSFLANYELRSTEDDPLRQAVALLGASRADVWLTPDQWAELAGELGLVKLIIPAADRDSSKSRERRIGVVLTEHMDETLMVETDIESLTLHLEKKRGRFEASKPSVRYRFVILDRTPFPVEPDEVHQPASTDGS